MIRKRLTIAMLLPGLWAGSADGAVTSSEASGFAIEHRADIAVDRAALFALLAQPGLWWNSDHSYSGDARNMTLDPAIGGCFCETIPGRNGAPDGVIEHARIIYAAPPAALRLVGSLGPLQAEAVVGTLTFAIRAGADGKGSAVTMTYVVGGYVRGGADKLASAVDMVMGQQLAGLKRAAETQTKR